MEKSTLSFLTFTLFAILIIAQGHGGEGSCPHQHHPRKLFVFGDAFGDTGNAWKSNISLKEPFGITYPGKPTGRYSDGRVLTDYIAQFLGIKSLVPYKSGHGKTLRDGVNFASARSGVFNAPKMTAQIHYFGNVIKKNRDSKRDLNSSIALITLSGGDYVAYFAAKNSTRPRGLKAFAESVVHHLGLNLKRIHDLGVPKIAVTTVQPLGCLPLYTASSNYTKCSARKNSLSNFHNKLLKKTVEKLNKETKKSTFIILDLYHAFLSILKGQQTHKGHLKFENPLKPCCGGVNAKDFRGIVGKRSGAKKYSVCKNPRKSFFWDGAHPSQSGWRAVFSTLISSLHQLC